MTQYIPEVSEKDIDRLIARDYQPDKQDEIRQLLLGVTVGGKLRVIAACLKNGGGNFAKLKSELLNANGYWREIISEAEYPKIKKASKYSETEIHEKQKEQYLKWFNDEKNL